MKKFFGLRASVFIALIGLCIYEGCSEEQAKVNNSKHIPIDVSPTANEIRLAEFNLSKPDARWETNGDVEMVYNRAEKCYDMIIKKHGYMMGMSKNMFKLKPNRNYVLSMLIRCDFDRENEINVGMRTSCKAGQESVLYNLRGIPAKTNGWERWKYEFTSYADPERAVNGQFYFRVFGFKTGRLPLNASFSIANVIFTELPPKPLRPFKKGSGVTFKGGPGSLPMRIESTDDSGKSLTVQTTGCLFTFDMASNTITAKQLIGHKRVVSCWKSSLPLDGLKITAKNAKECILCNDYLTIGIQCDSMMLISPQKPVTLFCEGKIGGRWNKLIAGHLLLIDDYGGMAVNPHIPAGSGLLPQYKTISGSMDKPGWNTEWTILPGERIGISVFPPRPFDWEKSFHCTYTITHPDSKCLENQQYKKYGKYVDIILLWYSFYNCSYAMGYGPEYTIKNEVEYLGHLNAIKSAGMKAITFMSPYFYHTHDPAEFIKEVRRFKKKYPIDGVYYDGVPSQDWIQAYEVMRLTRETFPDGEIILHTTGQTYNGGAPLARHDVFIPAIDTYATATLRGEAVLGTEKDWIYPKYITSQYGKANCIGIMKGNNWKGISQARQDIINLKYNGRARTAPYSAGNGKDYQIFRETYYPKLKKLEKLWEEKGSDPEFYEKYYLPEVKQLTK